VTSLLLLIACVALTCPTLCAETLADFRRSVKQALANGTLTAATIDPREQHAQAYLEYIAGTAVQSAAIAAVETSRTDKQVGATVSTPGSTSLVSKGSVPSILALAVENGALTQTVGGTTTTLRGNFVGLVNLAQNKGFLNSFPGPNEPTIAILERFSFALTFDANQNSVAPAPVTIGSGTVGLSGYSFRANIYNHRDPRDPSNAPAFHGFQSALAMPLNIATTRALGGVIAGPNFGKFESWLKEALSQLTQATTATVDAVLDSQMQSFKIMALTADPQVVPKARTALEAFGNFQVALKTLVTEIARKPILAVEYTGSQELHLPDLSNLRLIAEYTLKSGIDLLANSDVTLFDGPVVGTKSRVRDYKVSAEWTAPLGDATKPSAVFSLAGLVQRIPRNVPMQALRGDLRVFQAKLTIPLTNNGIQISISFTYANRTELLNQTERRLNFGLTFDLDLISSKLASALTP